MYNRRYTMDDWHAVKKALSSGRPIRDVASCTGVNRQTVFKWSRMDEPPERLWLSMDTKPDVALKLSKRTPRQRLDYQDRVMVFAMASNGATHEQIAETLGCHRTTVSRELKRASDGDYDPRLAQKEAAHLARRPKVRKLDRNERLRSYVIEALALHWSPEQISHKIRKDFPEDKEMRVSCETIYQALYVQGKGTLRHELEVEIALRSKRKGRKPRSKLPAKSGRPWIEGAEISKRPSEAADRAIPGHWEGDLVIGGDSKSCLITLIERRSRFLLMSRLCSHDAQSVSERLIEMVEGIPEELRRTLTWDQGSEMAHVADFKLATNFEVYFCDPHSPWQRPTNENVNGLIREFFPKGTNFTKVTDEEVAYAQWLLNNRPRKVLDWKFPSEAMQEVLAEGAMIV